MPQPSSLAITTSAVQRLIREEASYHNELSKQIAQLEKTRARTDEDENAAYTLKQEETAIEETRKVFPPLRERISHAVQKLEDQIESASSSGTHVNEEEISKANNAVAAAKEMLTKAI